MRLSLLFTLLVAFVSCRKSPGLPDNGVPAEVVVLREGPGSSAAAINGYLKAEYIQESDSSGRLGITAAFNDPATDLTVPRLIPVQGGIVFLTGGNVLLGQSEFSGFPLATDCFSTACRHLAGASNLRPDKIVPAWSFGQNRSFPAVRFVSDHAFPLPAIGDGKDTLRIGGGLAADKIVTGADSVFISFGTSQHQKYFGVIAGDAALVISETERAAFVNKAVKIVIQARRYFHFRLGEREFLVEYYAYWMRSAIIRE